MSCMPRNLFQKFIVMKYLCCFRHTSKANLAISVHTVTHEQESVMFSKWSLILIWLVPIWASLAIKILRCFWSPMRATPQNCFGGVKIRENISPLVHIPNQIFNTCPASTLNHYGQKILFNYQNFGITNKFQYQWMQINIIWWRHNASIREYWH